jgi:hypothetical protein
VRSRTGGFEPTSDPVQLSPASLLVAARQITAYEAALRRYARGMLLDIGRGCCFRGRADPQTMRHAIIGVPQMPSWNRPPVAIWRRPRDHVGHRWKVPAPLGPLCRAWVSLTAFVLNSRLVRRISDQTARSFPLDYVFVARKRATP